MKTNVMMVVLAVTVFAVSLYAGIYVLVGGFKAASPDGDWPGFENLTTGGQVMLTLMTLVCLGGPFVLVGGLSAIWIFVHKKPSK